MVIEATQPAGASAGFTLPTARDGHPPYTVSCTPEAGSVLPIGPTQVSCTATDAEAQQATCSFNIDVRVSQTLSKTRFLSFGDSITGGTVSPPKIFLDNPDSYPFKLQQMLREAYPSQEIVILNYGKGGERLNQGSTRLPPALDAEHPEVLILLQGIIDVRRIPTATNVQYLRTMITAARSRNIDVILGTLMPVSDGLEAKEPGINAAVVKLNIEIERLAQEYGLGPAVDLYSMVAADPYLIGQDNLHPTQEGMTRIAEKFRDAVVSRYHTPAP
jgi:lysophospholipase L1-like esterase